MAGTGKARKGTPDSFRLEQIESSLMLGVVAGTTMSIGDIQFLLNRTRKLAELDEKLQALIAWTQRKALANEHRRQRAQRADHLDRLMLAGRVDSYRNSLQQLKGLQKCLRSATIQTSRKS